jgi:hypothetical protein
MPRVMFTKNEIIKHLIENGYPAKLCCAKDDLEDDEIQINEQVSVQCTQDGYYSVGCWDGEILTAYPLASTPKSVLAHVKKAMKLSRQGSKAPRVA